MGGVFISYRRQDSAAYAGRLRNDLSQRYGQDRVFLDIEDIPLGVSFSQHLARAIEACELVLVLIGPVWASVTDPEGRSRLQDPEDFVRTQVHTALATGKRVLPVLVGGAQMPWARDLPEDLEPLSHRQAIELSDARWESDRDRLFALLDDMLAPARAAVASQDRLRRSSLWSRIGRALDVLRGHEPAAAPAPEPAPASGPAPAPAPAPAPPQAPAAAPARAAPATPPMAAHQVFVSYASEDQAFAAEVVMALEASGHRCWYAQRDIPPAAPSWAEPIATAIANSRLALVLLTAHSVPSMEVAREVTLAAVDKIPLLPVTLDGTPLSPALRYYFVAGQRLDVAQLPPADQIGRIVPTVARCLPAG